jgi:hypothetical protein
MIWRIISVAGPAIDDAKTALKAANVRREERAEIVAELTIFEMQVPRFHIHVLGVPPVGLDIDSETRRVVAVGSRPTTAAAERTIHAREAKDLQWGKTAQSVVHAPDALKTDVATRRSRTNAAQRDIIRKQYRVCL